VSDRNIHIADKTAYLGSTPDTYGSFQRSLMFAALSLGLPRKPDLHTIAESEVTWDRSAFTTYVVSKRGTNNSALATAQTVGKLTLKEDGLPASASIPALGDFPGFTVTYEYAATNYSLPSAFVVNYAQTTYRFQFLSLQLGTNDMTETGGYVPSMFADMSLKRHVTLWTNDLPYSQIDGKSMPAFRPPAPKLGEPAPELQGKRWFNTAQPLTLGGLRGKVVMLDFWGTWCPPCVEGLPHVQAQYNKFKAKGLVVIGIHTGWGTEENLEGYLKSHKISFPVVVDTDLARADLRHGATADTYVLDDLPSYALVDKLGNLVWKSTGGAAPTDSQIKELLGGK
jgi:thiol-disulfide isomerase/thioredoxin